MSNRKIKIAHVTQALGGVEVYIRNVCTHINDFNFQSHVILPPGDYSFETNNRKKIQQYFVPFDRQVDAIKDFKAFTYTIQHLKKIQPHIVHAHSAKGGVIGRLAGKILGISTIYTPHAFSFLSTPPGVKRSLFIMIEKLCLPFTSTFLACSDSELELGRKVIGVPKRKGNVWLNSVDPVTTQLREKKKEFQFPYICTFGRPSYQKNTESIISLMRCLRNYGSRLKCLIVGIGHFSPLERKIREMIKNFNLEDRIIMLGWRKQADCLNILSNAFCYVSASRYEGLPLSILEAMSVGKVVIATDVVGNRDCVKSNKTGFLVPLNDHRKMAELIFHLENKTSLRKNMGQQARKLFFQRFDITSTIGSLENIYKTVADDKHTNGFVC